MPDFSVCTIKPYPGYLHADAFSELAELLLYSLQDIGYSAILKVCNLETIQNLDESVRNIVIGPHLLPPACIAHIPDSTIFVNTEQINSNATAGWKDRIVEVARKFEVWDYSHRNLAKLGEFGIAGVKLLQIGHQPELARIKKADDQDIDVLFYGSLNSRRTSIIDQLRACGLKVECLSGTYGKVRDEYISRSKIVLNMHYYADEIFEIVRVSYLLSNSVPVVAEVNATTAIPEMYAKAVSGVAYEKLVDECVRIVGDPVELSELGGRGLNVISQHPQSEYTKKALEDGLLTSGSLGMGVGRRGMVKGSTICLNMIVRNESHIIRELFDSIVPFITTWVIVDTGSDDGTQDVIRDYFAERGVPGVLHERPWRNFGANRTEAMQLAQGCADYIWVMDADDYLVGAPDLSNMNADSYKVPIKYADLVYQRRQVFRSGLPWRWVGVVHEYSACDQPVTEELLPGDFWVQARTQGARSQDPEKFLRDAELLLAEVHRNPDDVRSVFYLAQSYRDYGDLRSARQWYIRRAEMGGWVEEVFCSLLRVAECMAGLGEPWPMVQDAYLKAWAYRPTRAEPLCAIASYYRSGREWQLGYLFAKLAAEIPLPVDILFVRGRIYTITARDELAICASWLGKHEEAFTACQEILARDDLDDVTRQRIVTNRDFAVPAMLDAGNTYPEARARSLTAGPVDADVTVTLIAGPGRARTECTLNSFLNYCTDIDRVGRFLLIDAGLSTADATWLCDRYPFLELRDEEGDGLTAIGNAVHGRLWLHLDQGWQFFAPEPLIGRLTAILETEPTVYQVGVNFNDATAPNNQSAPQSIVRSHPDTGRYTLTTTRATGPAMYDTTRNNTNHTTATLAEITTAKQPH